MVQDTYTALSSYEEQFDIGPMNAARALIAASNDQLTRTQITHITRVPRDWIDPTYIPGNATSLPGDGTVVAVRSDQQRVFRYAYQELTHVSRKWRTPDPSTWPESSGPTRYTLAGTHAGEFPYQTIKKATSKQYSLGVADGTAETLVDDDAPERDGRVRW